MKRINELRKMLIVRVTQSGMTTETKPKKKKNGTFGSRVNTVIQTSGITNAPRPENKNGIFSCTVNSLI